MTGQVIGWPRRSTVVYSVCTTRPWKRSASDNSLRANVEDRPAAYLVYQDAGGHRVSVLVFDPETAAPLDAPSHRVIDGREVFYRSGPGISTAAYHDRGLGYVVTSDLDVNSLTQLVSASFH